MWRWCFFGAGLAPVWYLSGVIVDGCLFALEARLFTIQQAFYFVVAMKVGAPAPPPITSLTAKALIEAHSSLSPCAEARNHAAPYAAADPALCGRIC